MKQILKERIKELITKKNTNHLKDVIAYCMYMQRVGENRYLFYDEYMAFDNMDLWYVVEISDIWFIDIASEWYATKELAETFYLGSK